MSSSPQHLSDRELVAELTRAAANERQATAHLIALLMEMDTRQLYLGEGFFIALHFLHQSLRPQPDAPAVVRKLPTPAVKTAPASVPANQPLAAETAMPTAAEVASRQESRMPSLPEIVPRSDRRAVSPIALAPDRYKIHFTATRETYEKLRRAQALPRHAVPDGSPAVIIDRALTLLLADVERKECGAADRPREVRATSPGSRHVPAAVKRAVWQRDGGRCHFIGAQGQCTETGFLEYHHVIPFAEGGATTTENLELRCRAHHQHEAERWFGPP